MKHEISSMQTKKALAAALKKLASEKPFSKITVREIISVSGFNRNTFYYHFEDVYALLKWMLEQETIEVVKQFDLIAGYEEAILFVMDYVEKNDALLNNIYHSMGRDELQRFFYSDCIGITRSIIDQTEKIQGLAVPEDFKAFLSQFYTQAIAGMLLEWITDRSVRNRERTVQYISIILTSTLPTVLCTASGMEDAVKKRCEKAP